MTCPTPQTYDPTRVLPLFTRMVDTVNSFIQSYTRSIPLGYVTIDGIKSVVIDPPVIKEPTTVSPCYPGCGCTSAVLQFADVSIILNASSLALKTVFKDVTIPVRVELSGITMRIETDCQSTFTITSASLGRFNVLEPDPSSTAGKIISSIPDPAEQIQKALEKYVVGRKFTLPVRVDGLPLLCAPTPEIINMALEASKK